MDQRDDYPRPDQPPSIWWPEAWGTVVEVLIVLGTVGTVLAAGALWLALSGHQPR